MTMPAETRLLGVERAVAAAFESENPGDRLVYCENLLIPGMFGLIFWSAIYAEVPVRFSPIPDPGHQTFMKFTPDIAPERV